MPHPGLPIRATLPVRATSPLLINSDEDLQFIAFTRGTQTSPDPLTERYETKCRDYNLLSLHYDGLDEKYQMAKKKFAEAKDMIEFQKARDARYPILYRDAYTTLLQEHRALEKKYREMQDTLKGLLDS